MKPFVTLPDEGRTMQGPAGGPLTMKALGDQTAGSTTALENVIAPGEGPPLHLHRAQDEIWYLLEGALRFRLGDEVSHAPEGSLVFVPRGTPHCFQNVEGEPARILVVFTPAGMEGFFEGFAQMPPGPVDPEAFAALAGESGMEVVGPPLAQSHPI